MRFLLEKEEERLVDAFEGDMVEREGKHVPAIIHILVSQNYPDILQYLTNEHSYVFKVEHVFNFMLGKLMTRGLK